MFVNLKGVLPLSNVVMFEQLVELERFNTVFRPRIQALDAANYNPLADADDT